MNYKEARIKYYEYYVDFENLIFDLLDIYLSKNKKSPVIIKHTEGFKLSDAIYKLWPLIENEINYEKYQIRKKTLIAFKGYRNDLAHKHGSIKVPENNAGNFEGVLNINKILELLKSA